MIHQQLVDHWHQLPKLHHLVLHILQKQETWQQTWHKEKPTCPWEPLSDINKQAVFEMWKDRFPSVSSGTQCREAINDMGFWEAGCGHEPVYDPLNISIISHLKHQFECGSKKNPISSFTANSSCDYMQRSHLLSLALICKWKMWLLSWAITPVLNIMQCSLEVRLNWLVT